MTIDRVHGVPEAGAAVLGEGLEAMPSLLALWAAGHVPAGKRLRGIAASVPPDRRWVVAVVDWWSAVTLGQAVDDSRWLSGTLPELAPHPHLVRVIAETSGIDMLPLLQILIASETREQLATRARSQLIYAQHGNLDTQAELDAFNELVRPLRDVVDAGELGVGDLPKAPTQKEIDVAARAARLDLNSARYRVMLDRLERTWEAFRHAAEAERSASHWSGDAVLARELHELRFSPVTPPDSPPDVRRLVEWLDAHPLDATVLATLSEEATMAAAAVDAAWIDLDDAVRVRAIDVLHLPDYQCGDPDERASVRWSRQREQLAERLELLSDGALGPGFEERTLEVELAIEEGDLETATIVLDELSGAREARDRTSRRAKRRDLVLEAFAELENPPQELQQLAHALKTASPSDLTDTSVDALRDAVQNRYEAEQDTRRAHRAARLANLRQELTRLELSGPVLASAQELLEQAEQAEKKGAAPQDESSSLEPLDALIAQQRELRQIATDQAIALLRSEISEVVDLAGESDLRAASALRDAGDLPAAERTATRGLVDFRRRTAPVFDVRDGEAYLVDRVIGYVRGRLNVSPADIRRVHVALKAKPFLILAGLSGSGKSSLARLYAEAVGASVVNGQFSREAVQPNWVDASSTLGFYNPVMDRFEPGWLTDVIVRCLQSPDLPHFVILDEMNLAPVEYYLADVLSVMEDARDSGDAVIRLYPQGVTPVNAEKYEPTLRFPRNLFIIGTVNTDETTRTISHRVLDRASYVQLDTTVDSAHHRPEERRALVPPIQVRMRDWRTLVVSETADTLWVHDALVEIAKELGRVNIGLGLRSHLGIESYVANARGVLGQQEALDAALLQRVIPKIRGFKRKLEGPLERLAELFGRIGAHRCRYLVEWWLSDALDVDDFLDGGDQSVGIALSGFVPEYETAGLEGGALGATDPDSEPDHPWDDDELTPIVAELIATGEYFDPDGKIVNSALGAALHARVPRLRTKTGGLKALVTQLGHGVVDTSTAKTPRVRAAPPAPEAPARRPEDFRVAVVGIMGSDAWRTTVEDADDRVDLTILGSLLSEAGVAYADCGFPKLSVALQFALTDTAYCVDDEDGTGRLRVSPRRAAVNALPDITAGELTGRLGAEIFLRTSPRCDPVPVGLTERALTMLMREAREWSYDELTALGRTLESRPEDWVGVIRNLVAVRVLSRVGPAPAPFALSDDIDSPARGVSLVASELRRRLESSSWGFSADVVEGIVAI